MKVWDPERRSNTSLEGVVCVIDGDQGIRNSLYTLLGTLGIRAVTFSTAEEFLARWKGESPSFLITELVLPGMGGFELKGTLDQKGIPFPVIGLTSESDEQQREQASRLGFLDLVEKPFIYWSVIERVHQTSGVPC